MFQVILVIKNAAVHNLAKGMKNDQFFRLLRVCVFKTLGVMFSRHHAIISQEWTKSFVSSTSKLRHEKGNHYPPHAACCSGFFRIPSKRVLFLIILRFSEMNQTFPWVLSAKYLTAGLGSVMGILSAALASVAMRELSDNSIEKLNNCVPHRKVSFLPSTTSCGMTERKTSFNPPDEIMVQLAKELKPVQVITTEKSPNGVMETSFP